MKQRYNSKNQGAWYLDVVKSRSVKGKTASLLFIKQAILIAVVYFAFARR